ncbi:hypothetical protein KHS38_14065 [Mucilaginibacter sp. Bleaf8]|nr:hypothetical protein [Mucilaginibacter sp. Bleaf8]
MMIPHMLEKAERLLEHDLDFSVMNLNDLLEFHHVHKHFEGGFYLVRWSEAVKLGYEAKVKEAIQAIKVFLFNLAPADFSRVIGQLEFSNRSNFWQLFRYFEIFKRVDKPLFAELLNDHPRHIRYILSLEKLVQFYSAEVRAFLLSAEESAEILLGYYEQKHIGESPAWYFPKALTDNDKEEIINVYLDSEEPNLNFVELVRHARQLKLSPRTRLKAKQVAGKIKEPILNSPNATRFTMGATLNKDQDDAVAFETDADGTMAIYGGKYFDSLRSDLELFLVFSNLFLYSDKEGLITLVSHLSEMDQLEKLFTQSRSEYMTGMVFAKKNMLSMAQLGIFGHYLKERGRPIEAVIDGFINDFFKEIWGMANLIFKMPQADLSAFEKIRLLAPDMEYLLKQYKAFVNDGDIEHELLQMDSTPLNFSDLPSLLAKKYLFSTHSTILELQAIFFNPNSMLARRGEEGNDETVFHALATKPMLKTDFEDYQRAYIERFISEGYLTINEEGVLEMVDPVMIFIAGRLYETGHISYWHYSSELRVAIDRMTEEGLLEVSDRLLTKEETSYLNFYLNAKEFSNGLDLRNKYLHGSHGRDIKQQEMDYLYFLRTFIVILIKLCDDVVLWQKFQRS